jgi:hypothetical protein
MLNANILMRQVLVGSTQESGKIKHIQLRKGSFGS